MRVLTAEQMRDLDRQTIEDLGVPGVVLMENAGRGAAELLARHFGHLQSQSVRILCGKGNNGGDGYVIARHLLNWHWQVNVIVLADAESITGDAAVNLGVLQAQGGSVEFAPDEETLLAQLEGDTSGLVVDALFGTGLVAAPRGHYLTAIEWINQANRAVVAVDIPSGVDATRGNLFGCAVRADLTVSFAAPKLGHLLQPGAGLCGQVEIVDIGIPPNLRPQPDDRFVRIGSEEAAALLPERPVGGHKGTFGHLLLLAGSAGKSGAAVLAAEAGLRAGAGLVTLAAPASQSPILASRLVEVMTEGLPDEDGGVSLEALGGLIRLMPGKQVLAMGPGLGQAEETVKLIRSLLVDADLPIVLDADGLNALAGDLSPLSRRKGAVTVLTPHPGEMARLCGISVADVESDRLQVARGFSTRHQVVLVLKGAPTLVAAPDGSVSINASGSPLLASAGSGDVLTGVIASLLAQGLRPEDAARLGVFLHGAAADRLARTIGQSGLLAGELSRELPAVRESLLKKGVSPC